MLHNKTNEEEYQVLLKKYEPQMMEHRNKVAIAKARIEFYEYEVKNLIARREIFRKKQGEVNAERAENWRKATYLINNAKAKLEEAKENYGRVCLGGDMEKLINGLNL
jgi:hypothetical protein